MAVFNDNQVTAKGHSLLAKVLAGRTKFNFDTVQAGDGHFDGDVLELTQLVSPRVDGKIVNVRETGEFTELTCVVTNRYLTEFMEFREIGIRADDPDDGSILFAYANAGENASPMGPYNGMWLHEQRFTFKIYTANATDITATIEITSFASEIEFIGDGTRLSARNVQDALKELAGMLGMHAEGTVSSQHGVHGMMYLDGRLRIFDGENWQAVSTEGDLDAHNVCPAAHENRFAEIAGLLESKFGYLDDKTSALQAPPSVVGSLEEMLALDAAVGSVALRTDITTESNQFLLMALPASEMGNWMQLPMPVSPVQSVNSQTGNVNLGAADVGAAAASHAHEAHEIMTDNVIGMAAPLNMVLEQINMTAEKIHDHRHHASDINMGTLDIGRIPIGTTANQVAPGNHTHNASAINAGTLALARIPTGTAATQVALGNHTHAEAAHTHSAADINAGRLGSARLPTSATANRVLTVGTANADPSYAQVTGAMIAANTVTAAQLANVAALGTDVAIGANTTLVSGDAVIIGNQARSLGSSAVCLGPFAVAAMNGTAVGPVAIASAQSSVAVGGNAAAQDAPDESVTRGNISVGSGAITRWNECIAVGRYAEATNYVSVVAVGPRARAVHQTSAIFTPNNGTANRQTNAASRILLGFSGITPAGFAAFSNVSDRRDKRDIAPLKYDALEFINSLEPVQYRMDFRSDYVKYVEITEDEFAGLDGYARRHEVITEQVWSYGGSGIEWLLCGDTYFEPEGKYATEFLCKYEKDGEAALKAFNKTKAYRNLPEEERGSPPMIRLREAKFLRIQVEPDGTRAGRRYHNGFIAQQVEEAANAMGFDCPAVEFLAHNKDGDGVPMGDDLYSMKYTELLAPVVAALQALTEKNAALEAKNEALEARLARLEAKLGG